MTRRALGNAAVTRPVCRYVSVTSATVKLLPGGGSFLWLEASSSPRVPVQALRYELESLP